MYQDVYIVNIDNIQPDLKTVSIAVDHVIMDDEGKVVSKIGRHRRGFAPGAMQDVMNFLAENAPNSNIEITEALLNTLWTQEVIDNYNQLIQNTGNL